MIERKLISNRDNYIQKLIMENLYLAQMEVIEVNEDDLSATLKYGDNKYFKNCSLRGINLEIDENDDIYNVEIPELNSKLWCLVWNNQVIIIKNYRSEKLITKINNTEISTIDKNINIKCKDIELNIDGENEKVELLSGKIYINCDNENEPVVLGEKLTTLLNNMLDLISNTYNHLLQHMHQSTGPGSFTTPVTTTPSETARISEINTKLSNIQTEISNLSNILSNKNFGA